MEQAMTRVPRRQILFVSLGDEKKTAVFTNTSNGALARCFHQARQP